MRVVKPGIKSNVLEGLGQIWSDGANRFVAASAWGDIGQTWAGSGASSACQAVQLHAFRNGDRGAQCLGRRPGAPQSPRTELGPRSSDEDGNCCHRAMVRGSRFRTGRMLHLGTVGMFGANVVMAVALEMSIMVGSIKLPKCYRNVDRRTSRRATPADTGELRSCANVAKQLSRRCAKLVTNAEVRPKWAMSSRWGPLRGQVRSSLAQLRPFLAEFG